jgi:thiamine kinase-like enzyme
MATKLEELILTKLKINDYKVLTCEKGYRNLSYKFCAGKDIFGRVYKHNLYNLVVYKQEVGVLKKIKCANFYGTYLVKKLSDFYEFRDPISKIIKLQIGNSQYYSCIYNYVSGHTISWEAYTRKHIKQMSIAIARMHSIGFLEFLSQNPNWKNIQSDYEYEQSIIIDNLQKCLKYFSDAAVKLALKKKLNISIDNTYIKKLSATIEKIKLLSPTLLHMDFVRSNLLFNDNQELVGVIDFEKSSIGDSVFELARILAFLFVDCKYKTGLEIREVFLSNYRKFLGGKINNFTYLETLIKSYLIYDFYKFLRHNPYEDLLQNQHFLRTLYLLKQSSLP